MPALALPYRWAITLALIAIIVALSVVPGRPQPGDSVFVWLVARIPSLVQTAMHVVCYAALAALVYWCLEPLGSRGWRAIAALFLALLLGAGLEWYQTQIPGRYGTFLDVVLNAIGAVAGLAVALILL